jgi:hypothetical protein
MKIQPDLALHEILLAKVEAPIGLLEYAIDPIVQNRLGKVLAALRRCHATKRARQWRFRNYGLHSGDRRQSRLCRK